MIGVVPPRPVHVSELVDGNAKEVMIQVIASQPKQFSGAQVNALDALVDEIPREVEGFSQRDILAVTNGDTVHIGVGPDYLIISFSVPPVNWLAGLSLMDALCKRSHLVPPETFQAPQLSPWTWALKPYPRTFAAPAPQVRELYESLFQPENITLAVGGAITPGQAQKDWGAKLSDWPAYRAGRKSYADDAPPKDLEHSPSGLASVELIGPPIAANDAALPLKTLALVALGSGKGASLFRVERQALRMSYRQEALLWPTPTGWQSRLISLTLPAQDLREKTEQLRKALRDDVSKWTDADLQRAQGMADAVFLRGVDFSPFAFGPNGALDGSLGSRTFLQAYWQLKTGNAWDAEAFVQQMHAVKLDDLKSTAANMLDVAMKRVVN